jgi:predicted PurR-regulated permease PerM
MQDNNGKNFVIEITPSTIRAFTAKILVVLILGSVGGYFLEKDREAFQQKIEQLTFEKYQSQFQEYKENLRQKAEANKPPLNYIGGIIIFCIFFGLYELLALIIQMLIRGIIK